MIPYKSHRQSAVPKILAARLEIMKAIRTFATPDEDEQLRRRRAEIAAIRRDLEDVGQSLREACRDWALLARSHLEKFDPNQPRVPAGNPDGGQWTSGTTGDVQSIAATAKRLNLAASPDAYQRCLDLCYPLLERHQSPGSDRNLGIFTSA